MNTPQVEKQDWISTSTIIKSITNADIKNELEKATKSNKKVYEDTKKAHDTTRELLKQLNETMTSIIGDSTNKLADAMSKANEYAKEVEKLKRELTDKDTALEDAKAKIFKLETEVQVIKSNCEYVEHALNINREHIKELEGKTNNDQNKLTETQNKSLEALKDAGTCDKESEIVK